MGEAKREGDGRPRFVVPAPPVSHDTRALIAQLSARLVASASATRALLAWCEEHGLSSGPILAVRQAHVPVAVIDEEVMARLHPLAGKPILHRCVRLVRGELALAEADNWFLPHRMRPRMRDILERTDVPFGVVIQSLHPSRHTFRVRFLPLNSDRNNREAPMVQGAGQHVPRIILEHDAVIIGGNGNPLAVVRERFRAELLTFAFLNHSACHSSSLSSSGAV